MKAVQKIVFLTILAALILFCPSVSANDHDIVRQAGMEYVKAGEEVMVEGPFHLNGNPYWIVDYLKRGEAQSSLIYDFKAQQFTIDRAAMRKVYATREFKIITQADPLFYGVGDPSKISLSAKYDTQNVRNFATFALLDAWEIEALDAFLGDYERMAQMIASSQQLTDSLLRPWVTIKVNYDEYPLKILVETQDTTDHFSYERCQQLINAYENVYSEYSKLLTDLRAFSGTLDDMPPGTIIRQKLDIKITKESILGEIELVDNNGQEIRREIDLRKSKLNEDYTDQIMSAEERLQRGRVLNLKIVILLAAVIAVLILRYLRKRPRATLAICIIPMILLVIATPVMTQEIPSPAELLSRQVTDSTQVPIQIFTKGIDYDTARHIVEGYPLILEGESVYIDGPYYHEGKAYYLFNVVDDGVPTGSVIIVDVSTLHMVGSYPIIGRMMQTSILAGMVRQRPLYQDVDAELLESEAMKASESTMAVFLTRLAENIREGKELENRFIKTPDFETARDLGRNYKRGFLLQEKMKRLASLTDVEDLTHGFVKDASWLEAYSLIMKYQLLDKNLGISQARYRGRALNRIPLMQELAAAGLSPSKPQVVHDLTTDLIYGNSFIWRLGKIEPPYFASLPRKLGEISAPRRE